MSNFGKNLGFYLILGVRAMKSVFSIIRKSLIPVKVTYAAQKLEKMSFEQHRVLSGQEKGLQ